MGESGMNNENQIDGHSVGRGNASGALTSLPQVRLRKVRAGAPKDQTLVGKEKNLGIPGAV
jgi:hypothetical protein